MTRFTRRGFLRTVASSAIAAALPRVGLGAEQGPPARRPNIIFILADDLGYGDLGCYGQEKIKTPNIDRLSAGGARFTNSYSGSTVCAPSRCCLMTGLHTGHCFIRGNAKTNLRPEDTTVAEVLKGAGYTTALVGKWGLGQEGSIGTPNKKGFDYFYGYLDQTHAHNSYPTFLVRNEQRVKLRNVVPKEGKEGQGVATEKVDFSNDLMADEAVAFIERSKDMPFFLYYSPTTPHANNEAGTIDVPDLGIYKDMDWPEAQKRHAAVITRMDEYVGRIMRKLKELGIDSNTIVFFTSDNGPHKEGGNKPDWSRSSGPLRGIKRDLYEGGIRVPMIVRWPGRIKPRSTSDQPWAFWDFLPTAAALAKTAPPRNLDGISMLPAILGQEQKLHDYLYWEFHEGGFKQAIRMDNWKGVRLGTKEPIELYDLNADVGEKNNVAVEHLDIVKKIAPLFTTARTDSKEFPIKEPAKKAAAAKP